MFTLPNKGPGKSAQPHKTQHLSIADKRVQGKFLLSEALAHSAAEILVSTGYPAYFKYLRAANASKRATA
jgi:hypothetical protein